MARRGWSGWQESDLTGSRRGIEPTIVWINGAFGVGKSTVATGLARSLPRAMVFDPELIGTLLRTILPRSLQTEDYQDMPLWRDMTVAAASGLVRYRRTVVVPMTLVVPAYFEEIVGKLLEAGIQVRHFTLRAGRDTIEERLGRRPESVDWACAQIDRCVTALEHPRFAPHVETDGRPVADVIADIRHALLTPG